MRDDLEYCITRIRFDEDYHPSEGTRATTNFANLARGDRRRENLHNAFNMINNRFNALAPWDNPAGDRYSVALEIVSAGIRLGQATRPEAFPLIEILQPTILDRTSGGAIEGIAGNNFSSYLRDYDFSIVLPQTGQGQARSGPPERFGELHGNLFRGFLASPAYRDNFAKPPVICLSVSSSRTYHRTANVHPILGVEYRQDQLSPTDQYFGKMGLDVRFFMPPGSVAPLAFYFAADLLSDYSNLELVGTISTMETFQRIYRPEIYNANSRAAECFRPSLTHQDYSPTRIVYDREERARLAVEQGKFAETNLIRPYRDLLEQWSARYAA